MDRISRPLCAAVAACVLSAGAASATTPSSWVDARADSLTTLGTPLANAGQTGIFLTLGQAFSLSIDPTDTWSIDGSVFQQDASGLPKKWGEGALDVNLGGVVVGVVIPHGTLVGRVVGGRLVPACVLLLGRGGPDRRADAVQLRYRQRQQHRFDRGRGDL